MHPEDRKYINESNYEEFIGKTVYARDAYDWGDKPDDYIWVKGILKSVVLERHYFRERNGEKHGLFLKHCILEVDGKEITRKFVVEKV